VLPSEQVPPEVEDKASLSGRTDPMEARARRRARRIGLVLMVTSAIISLLLLYGIWLGLHAV
jgi:hypothetical protein